MEPATSDWNFTPSVTAPGSPPSTMAGVGLVGQIIAAEELTVTLRASVALCAPAVTWTVKLVVPIVVGVPEMMPAVGERASPMGSVPLAIDQVYGGVPPMAVRVALYAAPTVAAGRLVVVMVSGPGVTVSPVLPLTDP